MTDNRYLHLQVRISHKVAAIIKFKYKSYANILSVRLYKITCSLTALRFWTQYKDMCEGTTLL